MSLGQFGRISFSRQLAGQEPGIKFAALASLHEYFHDEQVPLSREKFWFLIDEFQDVTDGIHTANTGEIFRFQISPLHRGGIERLGFKFSPVAPAGSNDR